MTTEPTDEADPRSFRDRPIGQEILKASLYHEGAFVAPDDLDAVYLSEITDRCAAEAWRFLRDAREAAKEAARAELRAELAALLRTCAAGRTEYASSYSLKETNQVLRHQRETLEVEALVLESAAKIVEGEDSPLYGLLPSWRWTPDMERKLFGEERSRG